MNLTVFFTLSNVNWIVSMLVIISCGLIALTGWFIYRCRPLSSEKNLQKGFPPIVLIAAGLWALFMASYTTAGRLLTEVDATIVAREMTSGPRPAAIYTVRNLRGETGTFVAGATDASLPRQLPTGSHVTKHKWELGYMLNGKWVSDFSITFYSIIFALGANLLLFGIVAAVQQHRLKGAPVLAANLFSLGRSLQ